MVGPGSDAHIVMIMENYLAPMAIFAFEISLDRFDKTVKDPVALADYP